MLIVISVCGRWSDTLVECGPLRCQATLSSADQQTAQSKCGTLTPVIVSSHCMDTRQLFAACICTKLSMLSSRCLVVSLSALSVNTSDICVSSHCVKLSDLDFFYCVLPKCSSCREFQILYRFQFLMLSSIKATAKPELRKVHGKIRILKESSMKHT